MPAFVTPLFGRAKIKLAQTPRAVTVCDYVQLNPVRAKIIGAGKTLRDFP